MFQCGDRVRYPVNRYERGDDNIRRMVEIQVEGTVMNSGPHTTCIWPDFAGGLADRPSPHFILTNLVKSV